MKKRWIEKVVLFILGIAALNVFPILGVVLYCESPVRFMGVSVWWMYGVGWILNIAVLTVGVTYYVILKRMGRYTDIKELFLDVVFILLSLLMSFVIVDYFVNRLF